MTRRLLLLLCLALIAAPPTASARRSKKQKAHTPLKKFALVNHADSQLIRRVLGRRRLHRPRRWLGRRLGSRRR